MTYKIKGPIPTRPVRQPLRLRHLNTGELAVVTEDCEHFGKFVLCVTAEDDIRTRLVCLSEATIPCPADFSERLCRLLKPAEKVTLTAIKETQTQ